MQTLDYAYIIIAVGIKAVKIYYVHFILSMKWGSIKMGRGMRKRSKFFIVIITFFIVILVMFFVLDTLMRPVVLTISEARVEYLTTRAINNAVKKVLGNENAGNGLMVIITDNEGKVSMIKADTMRMNALAADTAKAAQDEILKMGAEGIELAVGSIFGSRLMAGRGPRLKVKLRPIGAVTTEFSTEFENAGINQTRHRIYLKIVARVRVVAPIRGDTIIVSSKVPISETIIVGDVPQYYVNVDEKDDMLNLIPDVD